MTRKDKPSSLIHKSSTTNQKSKSNTASISTTTTSSEGKKVKKEVERKKGISDPPPPLLQQSSPSSPAAETSSPNDDLKQQVPEEPIVVEEEIIYQDGEQDAMDRSQEIEVLQSIYSVGEEFVQIISNDQQEEFEIKIKGKLNFDLPSTTDIENDHFSISEIPFKLSHVGLKLCIKYVAGYPSQTLPKFKCVPLIDLDRIMSLVKSSSQIHAQLGLKKQMQQDEIKLVCERIRAKSRELLGYPMVYSFVQEIEEYLESNNVKVLAAEEEFQVQQKEKKILKTSVVLSMIGNASMISHNVLDVEVIAKYKQKQEEPEEKKKKTSSRDNVKWENIRNFKAKNRISIESYIKLEASYNKSSVISNFWMNRYGHASASNGNNLWFSFGGVHERRVTCDLVAFHSDSGMAKAVPIKESINPRVFHTFTYIVSAEIFVILGGLSENNDYYSDAYLIDNQFGKPNLQRLPTFPHKIAGHSASNCEDKLLVFGGYDGEVYYNQLHSITLRKPRVGFSSSTSWARIDSPHGPSPRSGSSSVVFRNLLYVYGGNNGQTFFDEMYVFDLGMQYWTKVVTFGTSTALSYSQLFVTSGDTLALMGGVSQHKTWNRNVLEFSMGRSTWTVLKCDQTKNFDERIPLCSIIQDNQNFVFTGGVNEKSLKFSTIAKISQSSPITTNSIPEKTDSIRKMVKRYFSGSEYSRNLFDVYYDMICSQIEKNSDLIINFYEKGEDGCTAEHRKIFAHQYVAISNPVFRKVLAIQNVRDRLNQQDYQYTMEADEENVLSFKNVYIDIQTFKGLEELTFNGILGCLQFVYSYSFDPELSRTDKECLELYDAAKKFKIPLLCEMLCNSISTESLKLTIGDFIEESMTEFLKSEPVSSEEEYFLNNANEFETYVTEKTKDTPYVRIVAPDLYSKLNLDRARYLKSIQEESLEEMSIPEEMPEMEAFDEELFEEIDSAKGEGFNWMTDVPNKSDNDLPNLEWKYIIVHKSILVYRSKFFRTMFNMDFSESKTNEIRLNDTTMQSIEAILYWMYSGSFPTILSENAIELFVTASQYDLPEVRDWSRSFIEKFIDVNNVLTILDIAEMIGDVNLKRFCYYYIANRLDIISRDPSFNDLPSNSKYEIKSLSNKIIKAKK